MIIHFLQHEWSFLFKFTFYDRVYWIFVGTLRASNGSYTSPLLCKNDECKEYHMVNAFVINSIYLFFVINIFIIVFYKSAYLKFQFHKKLFKTIQKFVR